ncbi:TetR/AcrR family transcriptional regulator [Pseudokineococcus sp. 1T1Z-3]|uniref:TetR/AcrR family transcriptional regulator n=1 Tax=Pseudokineococcus sp. 1T1Z-3 TaxID=3132745 RepID=UPI00309FE1FB
MASTEPATAARGAYATGRRAREEILDAALALFGESGYRGTSLRDVARRAGLSHPGLLHHFPRKEALLEGVLRRRDELDAAAEEPGSRGATALGRLVDVVGRNAAVPGVVELFCTLSAEATAPDHPAHTYFRERYARLVADLTRSLEQAAEDGDLRAGVVPATAARGLVAVMDGLQVQWLLGRDAPGPDLDMAADLRAHLGRLLLDP